MRKILIVTFVFSIVAIIICLSLLPNINYEKIEYVSSFNDNYKKLNNSKGTINQTSNSNEKIDDCKVTNEKVVIVQLYLDYDAITTEVESYTTDLYDYKELQKEFRDNAKAYHHQNNKAIISGLLFGNYQDIYVSTYSPFIDITYNYDYFMKHKNYILAIVSKITLVKSVMIYETEIEIEECVHNTCCYSGALDVYESRNRTGAGVVVGILENGVIDKNHVDLENTSITIRSSVNNVLRSKSHATDMARIIAGEKGVAPGASLLSASLSGTMNAEIDWMLDNGVDIINMSFVEGGNYGIYSSVSAYADYIAYTYDVIMVACAGNVETTGDYVGNPGLGYNVITVGSTATYCVSFESAYKEITGPLKPTVGILGAGALLTDNIADSICGTSVSTAFCSGLIALILEERPVLVYQKSKLISLICANSTTDSHIELTEDNGFDDEIGSGMFNYQNMVDNLSTAYYIENRTCNASSTFKTFEVYMTKGQTLRAAVCVVAKSDGTVNGIEFTDYDIFVYNNKDSLVGIGNSWNSTIDMVTYTATKSGYYTIEIYQDTDRVVNVDKLGFAYRIS